MFDTSRDPINQAAIDEELKATGALKLSPFDFVNAINQKKRLDFSNDWVEKQYDPFIINRSFLQNPATVNLAAFMDQYYFLDKRLQFEFYYHIIPKNNSYGKWVKASTELDEKIDLLKKVFGYSRNKSIEVIPLIKDWDALKQRISMGGKSK